MKKDAASEPRKKGRRALGLTPVPVRLAPDALARIEKVAGTYGRPKFIREAVEEKLAREEITR
jgi:hypothetical protein